jgi:hypothetical protein
VRDLELGGPCKDRREASISRSSWRAFNTCSEGNRHQRAPLLAYTWELGVILTARAPNRRRSSRAFCGRDDAGPHSPNIRRENGHNHFARHRPRGAAGRRRRILLQTQGLSRKGGWLAGIIRPSWPVHRSHGLSPILAHGGVWTQSLECATRLRDILASSTSARVYWTHGRTPASIQPPRRLTPGHCPSVLRHSPRTVASYG